MKGHKVDESRDELLCQVAVLSRGVSAMIHDALGSPSSPSRRDLDFQIVTLGVRCVNQLQVEEYSEAARAVLICCFLRQVRATFGRYDELADAFTLDSYLEITESARDMFFDSISRGYVVNVKRYGQFTDGRVVRAQIQVSDGKLGILYLE